MKSILIFMFSLITSTALGKPIKVAVLDSGLAKNSPDQKYVKKSFNFTETTQDDTDGHGTHIISLITDRGQLNKTDLEIIPMKVMSNDKTLLPYLNALKKVLEIRPNIINIAFVHKEKNTLEEYFLNKIIEAGITVVVASGNNGVDLDKDPIYPCSYKIKGLYCIGNKKEDLQSNSNYGSHITNWEDGDNQVGSGLGEELAIMSGSSQSTAIFTQKKIKNNIYRK